ncbi:MAG TPA: hypothetical protein VF399_07485 [bacterium]
MTNDENKFEKFLLSEYENIVKAHFKSIESITSFFRHYLLIMALPLSAVAVLLRLTSLPEALQLCEKFKDFLIIVLLSFVFIGILVSIYIINHRFDAILYARTVNGIRKYFYDNSKIDINFKLHMRSLPQCPYIPKYYEPWFFFPVVMVFAIINSLYACAALYIFLNIPASNDLKSLSFGIGCMIIYVCLWLIHTLIYEILARRRETKYLKSNILGIDIDGVLNKHREQFCNLLREKTNNIISIKPEDIHYMPVHKDPNLNVTRDHELAVFNDPQYWKDMPIIEHAYDSIRDLRNKFKLKIYVFTWRGWPEHSNEQELLQYIDIFLGVCNSFSFSRLLFKILRILSLKKYIILKKEIPLKQITNEWLKANQIKYDRLIFEKGNDYSSDPRGHFNNRFYLSREKNIRFFVEDDIEKAVKLSYICDVVFLLSHPYNEPLECLPDKEKEMRNNLPSNIIRVQNWKEIYDHIKRIS